MDLSDLVNTLQKAEEAEKLLATILSHYDIYSGEFRQPTSYDCDYGNRYSLINRVREYIKFDDSE